MIKSGCDRWWFDENPARTIETNTDTVVLFSRTTPLRVYPIQKEKNKIRQ